MYNVLWRRCRAVTDEDTERLVADIPKQLKELMKADPRTIREITESALNREFQTAKTAALERRIEEKRSRLNQLEHERNERQREIAEVEDDLSRLEATLERAENSGPTIDDAVDALSGISSHNLTVDNEAVKNWADKLDMPRESLLSEVKGQR